MGRYVSDSEAEKLFSELMELVQNKQVGSQSGGGETIEETISDMVVLPAVEVSQPNVDKPASSTGGWDLPDQEVLEGWRDHFLKSGKSNLIGTYSSGESWNHFSTEGKIGSNEFRKWLLDRPASPFSKFVGNEKAIRRLKRSLFSALGRSDHSCPDNLAFLGPASAGKTVLNKLCADVLSIPFVEIHPRSITTGDDLLQRIAESLDNFLLPSDPEHGVAHAVRERSIKSVVTLELEPEGNKVVIPPCWILFDEVHALKKNVEQMLLKATERGDRTLVTENGWVVDLSNVTMAIATTDRGLLFDAFDTRFTKIHLRYYSKAEIANIVKIVNPEWSDEVCSLVSRYGGLVPREALGFAHEMRLENEMNPDSSWEEIAWIVAQDHGIDKLGMSLQRLEILKTLHDNPVSKSRMADVAGCKEEELVKFIMPPLMAKTPDQEPLVTVTSKGYTITEAGERELELRNKAVRIKDVSFLKREDINDE